MCKIIDIYDRFGPFGPEIEEVFGLNRISNMGSHRRDFVSRGGNNKRQKLNNLKTRAPLSIFTNSPCNGATKLISPFNTHTNT